MDVVLYYFHENEKYLRLTWNKKIDTDYA